jgi:ribokinase
MHLGGKGFNQAVAARRLGADVSVIGRVGDDEFGRAFIAALNREDIDARYVTVDADASTGVASIIVEPDGGNAVVQAPRANRRVAPAGIAAASDAFAAANVAMLQLETSDEAAVAFAKAARDTGAKVLLNPAPAAAVPDAMLAFADIIVPNEVEAATLTGTRISTIGDAYAAGDSLCTRGPSTAIITLGANGAVVVAEGLREHIAGMRVVAIDTVGAGDAFCAALAVAVAEGASIIEAARFANAAGAAATTRPGAEPSMPSRATVEALLRDGGGR